MTVTSPILRRAGKGDGHPVLVLPGFTADDQSTRPLREILRHQGYRTHGWQLGTNIGPTAEVIEGLTERLHDVHGRDGRTVSIVGWSLGGIYARELARQFPDEVRQAITLGSPFRMVDGDRSSASRVWDSLSHLHDDPLENASLPEHERESLTVPATAIYSRTDGIVRWQKCIEADGPLRENIEVTGSHCGLGFNPAVVIAVSDRLAQPEGQWRPFQPTLLQRSLFPHAARWYDRAA
jgi:pimeloyl-ACP methyl ester carboxylesterase